MSLPHPDSVRPLGNFVLIEVEPRKELLDSGIALPRKELDIEHVMEGVGRVVRAGPGRTITKGKRSGEVIPPPVKVGDRVAFRRFLKDAIPLRKVGETEYCLIAAGDLMATLPEGVEIGVFSERRPEE